MPKLHSVQAGLLSEVAANRCNARKIEISIHTKMPKKTKKTLGKTYS